MISENITKRHVGRSCAYARVVMAAKTSFNWGELERASPSRLNGCAVYIYIKYEKHFPKMYGDVGMAVPKITQTRYMDGSVQATQMTTQVTPSLHHFSFLSSTQSSFQYSDNKA